MTRTSYKSLQRAIARDDKHSIESRWEYGRAILNDPKKMSASGKSLRHGATEALIANAKAVGTKLTEREIQWRIQCARAYKSISEIRTASTDFEDWTALRNAGFPPVSADETPSPESLLDDIENTDPQEYEQPGLFPAVVKNIPLERATLRTLVAYADEMRDMTASFARRDAERATHLRALRAAVGDDLDVLYPDAMHALHAKATAPPEPRTPMCATDRLASPRLFIYLAEWAAQYGEDEATGDLVDIATPHLTTEQAADAWLDLCEGLADRRAYEDGYTDRPTADEWGIDTRVDDAANTLAGTARRAGRSPRTASRRTP